MLHHSSQRAARSREGRGAGRVFSSREIPVTSASHDVISFLLDAMAEEGKDREADTELRQEHAAAAAKTADAQMQKASALEKQASAAVLEAKAKLLDKVIKCNNLGIPVP
eukprot:CAMPEP_0196730056 /NCGR_PEP_ID=MMETSP1091-20130531/10219_1 /TAXON_ID=302021 /ORGANISM="Rhodomonas sp., Strain CCMP768" /LENGTH=109 /DNA_ID=CAMNT_0042073001 /DNA_START=516 /DNA_END=841 /DNA_ORIENTATION=-